jgi:AraC family transcriptional regulator, regulatory protein of adaptative response / methylated-DNA-[protein]-cysteine methyltransferase
MNTLSADICWAVLTGQTLATAPFIYAVMTTGICCRPGCPSRLPARRNVRFFADTADAVAAGFRPCKRCRPDQAALPLQQVIDQVCDLITSTPHLPTLRQLAAAVSYSPAHLQRIFQRHVGVSPHTYAVQLRLHRLRTALDQQPTVRAAIAAAGFSSPSTAYRSGCVNTSRALLKGSPMSLHYALSSCRLGTVLVAASPAGIAVIDLADTAQELIDRLLQRFPQAEPGQRAVLDDWLVRVVALIDHPHQPCDLPLDLQGTAFQRRVWAALQQIPAGETRNYRSLAAAIGAPTAARAVAAACAANTLAVAIPCHRVVRSDGSLSGYRWGVERKRALLTAERMATSPAAAGVQLSVLL